MSDPNMLQRQSGLAVGIAEVDITPAERFVMGGMLEPVTPQGVHWPLMGRIMAVRSAGGNAAVVSLDLQGILSTTVAELRHALSAVSDVAAENIFIACSHTHRGPQVKPGMDRPVEFGYVDFLAERLAECLARADAACRPARLRSGTIEAPGWTFNRRPIYRTDRGEQVGTQGPHWVDEFIRLEGPADHELKVLVAEDVDGGVIGGLVNYSCHPTIMGGKPVYSADFPGPLTGSLSSRLGGIFLFLQGAAGDLWAFDMSTESPRRPRGAPHAQAMGEALAECAVEALAAGRTVSPNDVRVGREFVFIPNRRPTPEQVALAREYLKGHPPDLDQREFTRRLYGHDYTFYNNSPAVQEWFCRETVGLWETYYRSGRRQLCEEAEVMALAFGDLAIVGIPGELFAEFGMEIKARSPFRDTILVELANGHHGYIPTRQAFAHGGYEPRLAQSSRLVPEAGDQLCETALTVLHRLKES